MNMNNTMPHRPAPPVAATAGTSTVWIARHALAKWKMRYVPSRVSCRRASSLPVKHSTFDASHDVRSAVEAAVQRAGYILYSTETPKQGMQETSFWRENGTILLLIVMMAISWLSDKSGAHQAGQLIFIITTLIGLDPIALRALRLMCSGTPFAIETLMSVAAAGALFIGASAEAAMVLLLFLIGERLEAWAASGKPFR